MTLLRLLRLPRTGSVLAATGCLAAFSGCVAGRPGYAGGPSGGATVVVQCGVMFQDDYDYFPGFETYYSRNRHEYVYRDGNAWVRRPAPRGITANVLLTMPSVRVDFHDSPEQHHDQVVTSYPKNWKRPEPKSDSKSDHRVDQVNGKQAESPDDKNEHQKGDRRKDADKQD